MLTSVIGPLQADHVTMWTMSVCAPHRCKNGLHGHTGEACMATKGRPTWPHRRQEGPVRPGLSMPGLFRPGLSGPGLDKNEGTAMGGKGLAWPHRGKVACMATQRARVACMTPQARDGQGQGPRAWDRVPSPGSSGPGSAWDWVPRPGTILARDHWFFQLSTISVEVTPTS